MNRIRCAIVYDSDDVNRKHIALSNLKKKLYKFDI